MAIIWEKHINNDFYQVKTAGSTRRVYKNGVLHSQLNPSRLFTGSVWDLLSVPALFHPLQQVKRILLLGVGGGTVIHQLSYFSHFNRIVGIDLDKTQLMIARKFFALKSNDRIKLCVADAKSWLQNAPTQQFDMIIDDIFTEHEGQPIRAVTSDSAWMQLLLSRLDENGILVQNYADRQELRNSAAINDMRIYREFKTRLRLTTEHYENNVAVFCREVVKQSEFRQRLTNLKSDEITINRSTLSLKIRNITT